MKEHQDILSRVLSFYTASGDFNGITGTALSEELGIDYLVLLEYLRVMLKQDLLSIQSGNNPHIIIQNYPVETQLSILEDAKNNKTTRKAFTEKVVMVVHSHQFCVYPSVNVLKKQRDVSAFSSLPFTKYLALGEPQLKPLFFDIDVLDRYYRDPRYRFDFDDYSGSIGYRENENHESLVNENDQVFLQTFGLGRDGEGNRLAVVYLRYLHNLTPDHQMYWKSKERIGDDCKMMKEYYDNTVLGLWEFSYSVFSAFIHEQKALNELALKIFGIGIFRQTFEETKRPKEFTFFFIPTLENYNSFVLLMDKMISDNLNQDFFKGGIELYELEAVGDNQVERKIKGTLRLLKEWLGSNIQFEDANAVLIITGPFVEIRKQRQQPAHKIVENVYDKVYSKRQQELVSGAYHSLHQLRHLFQKHPEAADVEIPEWLDNGQIKPF